MFPEKTKLEAGEHSNKYLPLANLGLLDEAIKEYRKAIQINPGYATAHYYIANALKAEGLIDAAIRAFENFKRYAPPPDAGNVEKIKGDIRKLKMQR